MRSISATSQLDKEQLAQALDKIHTSASQSDVLTTFNDFGPPPSTVAVAETKGSATDIVQQGLSGLYSRFKEAVGVAGKGPPQDGQEGETPASSSKKPLTPLATTTNDSTKGSMASLPRSDTALTTSTFASAPSSDTPSGAHSAGLLPVENHQQVTQSSRASSSTVATGSKTTSASSQNLPKMAKLSTSTVADPAVASVSVGAFKEGSRVSSIKTDRVVDEHTQRGAARRSLGTPTDGVQSANLSASSSLHDVAEVPSGGYNAKLLQPKRARRDDSISVDGSPDTPLSPAKSSTPAIALTGTSSELMASSSASRLASAEALRRPTVIDRISKAGTSAGTHSRSSSMDPGTAEPSPISTSAHNSVYHDSFAHDEKPEQLRSGKFRIPGTTTDEGAPEMVNARLEIMRNQVLSKEFWMADETCKECFLCGDPFSAFRRKHHCRTCGCIFDSKCTSTISGQKFGVTGNLRVCKTCLNIINRRYESGSDDSGDDTYLPAIFRSNTARPGTATSRLRFDDDSERTDDAGNNRTTTTPMMAIPATRRLGDPSNRHSAILEIDAPQLSRPGSSRSLKSLTSGRPMSSGHKRHHSKHNFLGRFKTTAEERAPFRSAISEEMRKKSKLPAFHDDNIIDPELAPYMSDESSGDEQMSIFATMASNDLTPSSLDPDKSNFGPFLSAGRKHRLRQGEKSISGLSFTTRGLDDGGGLTGAMGHARPNRRRNMSTTSASQHHLRSPRPKSAAFKGPTNSTDALGHLDLSDVVEATKLTRSNSIKEDKASDRKLGSASLDHVKKLFIQLLEDAGVPNPLAWEKALIPILLKCSDDVDPDSREGDAMDIRHYVKLKKIPGGKPGDTSYVSGVIFTKNLALKSMPRSIINPRIVIVTFPIEYQRHQQQHFMSLQPVIEQEKEYLRLVVNRIIALRPQVLLAERSISGVALQFLSEANIAVAYNVKSAVIEAVSRCTKAEIISSLDMLALPTNVGTCSGFEVKTFVNSDFPGRKKTYIFVSGCDESLGCTIALRGAPTRLLSRMKRITEFMVYVVYNLKLESCLMRDEVMSIPGEDDAMIPGSQHTENGTADSEAPAEDESSAANPSSQQNDSPVLSQSSEGSPSDQADGVCQEPTSQSLGELPIGSGPPAEPQAQAPPESQVPEDVPAPTFYSDMVAKYETKILSASPFVKFTQPYLLMKAREQERRLVYLKRLRDQDIVEEHAENEKSKPRRFQLIRPEMVHEIGQRAPRQIMEVLHAVHDAEYDRALHNYQTQTRQWENYIQGNLDLFDPYSHQNIVVLYSMVCTDTKIPCAEPGLIAISFYVEHPDPNGNMDPDCTLGQYIEDLCESADETCHANGCDRPMHQHHRTYVHDEARITIFVEDSPIPGGIEPNSDDIFMWTYCKQCKREMGLQAMSQSSWKYSFGKYLELSFWSKGLHMHHSTNCPHDNQRDHIRYFNYHGMSVRIHYDPIDLLEIVVPRARITWKVDHDLRLKNETFTKSEDRWNRFMNSVKARLKSIRIDSVLPEKTDACKAEVDRLTKKAQDEQPVMVRALQDAYMTSKYYEIIPLNAVLREMLERVADWDSAFAKFEADFLSDKDVRQLTMIQLKKMFTDNESKESLTTIDGSSVVSFGSESEEKSTVPTSQASVSDMNEKTMPQTPMDEATPAGVTPITISTDAPKTPGVARDGSNEAANILGRVEPLDLATPQSPSLAKNALVPPGAADTILSPSGPTLNAPQSPLGASPSPLLEGQQLPAPSPMTSQPSLSEKVEQLKKEHRVQPATENVSAETTSERHPEPTRLPVPERGPSRRAGSTVSPPMVRAISQPVGTLPRTQSSIGKTALGRDLKAAEGGIGPDLHKVAADGTSKIDKRFPERIGLGALKTQRKAGQSSIPRYVHKKKESKVSTLAKHFEQLSREFEKERMRDRKQRAAKMNHQRAFLPRTTTKAIVEVYQDVDQAVQEPGPDEEHLHERDGDGQKSKHNASLADNVPSVESSATLPDSDQNLTSEPPSQTAEDIDNVKQAESRVSSDDEHESDTEQSLEDILPDVETIAEHLEPSGEVPQELQKDKKSNLMKMLTNFWAERSASGWPPLEYPLNATDHIFIDSDVIVREDEPSSLIAFALGSEDYQAKLADIRRKWKRRTPEIGEDTSGISDLDDATIDETELEKSLLRATGTHLKYQFIEGSARMLCKIFYAEQFDALRRKCGIADRIIESLSRCLKWDSKGGKTKSVFLKTLDDRLVMKSLSPIETSAFLRFAPAYFEIMAEALFHELPSVIAKMVGFFQVIIKNPVTGTEIKLDLLVMENLFYDRSETRKFDLKGSMRNRKIQSTGVQDEVLLDENMVEYIYESPLFAREHSKKLLRASVWNDTLFLARQNVMDYSLMIAVDETRRELVVGIIDCIRTYTWDKKLESWIKDRGFAGGGRNKPTVTSPKEYKSRFREAMARSGSSGRTADDGPAGDATEERVMYGG
ncbi:uncharacterized protein E0L32_011226 [Thyridium curvatum]|uniref:1-phosphatidylinositol-3-phosphate 5-kinase n=1 Tax=Thyridium curvatum TaxID=1093900 RepID=A0A507B7C1_9PEZI|nr:uncharacterized protein E0L32_011226 [Thyridium curvatum]TPX19065.1 hypothetical protein E0L32_011226 [Thyridium curvatum]